MARLNGTENAIYKIFTLSRQLISYLIWEIDYIRPSSLQSKIETWNSWNLVSRIMERKDLHPTSEKRINGTSKEEIKPLLIHDI